MQTLSPMEKLLKIMKLAEETSDQIEQLKLDTFDLIFKLYEESPDNLGNAKYIMESYDKESDVLTDKIGKLVNEINSGEEA